VGAPGHSVALSYCGSLALLTAALTGCGEAARGADGGDVRDGPAPADGAGASDGNGAGDGDFDAAGGATRSSRAQAIPVGIENVNDSPLKEAEYRALLRFVPDRAIEIDRFYFGFKLRGAECQDAGQAGYGAGDGGLLRGALVEIDPSTGLPGDEIVAETVNGCDRYNEAHAELVGNPAMVWVNTPATLEGGRLYGLIVSNAHDDPPENFFSFNMPLADTELAGPHARNELDATATGSILALDPREHVAWSEDGGGSWAYGSENGQYRSYMNDNDTAHPATRMPQYGYRLADGTNVGTQPYYAYSDDCDSCAVTYANARYARSFTEVGGFTASQGGVGTLTIRNTDTGAEESCTPAAGYGFGRCVLPAAISVAVGESYEVRSTGSVEIMQLDYAQQNLFPGVGTADGELRTFQADPEPGTDAKDVPNLWAGPLSANFPTASDPP
jgi:hypothetical protein